MALKKISELPAATTVAGTDVLPVTQGAITNKITVDQVAGYARRTPINAQAGTTYTLALSDAGKVVRASNAGAVTVTVPPNSTAAIAVGDSIALRQVSTGQIMLSPGSGVTLNIPTGFLGATGRQHSTIAIHKVATNEWDVTGDLAAA